MTHLPRGTDDPHAGALPAHECLDPGDLAGPQVDLGLVVEPELVARERPPEVVVEGEPLGGAQSHAVLEDLVAVLAPPFRLVHRHVRVAQQVLAPRGTPVPTPPERDPDARRRVEVPPCNAHRRVEGGRDPGRHRPDLLRAGGVLQEHGELVAPEPGRRISRLEGRSDEPCDRHEQLVAGLVPQGVVYDLEVVQVHEYDCERSPVVLRPLQGVTEPIHKQGAIGEAGEHVVKGLVGEPVLQALALRDVMTPT